MAIPSFADSVTEEFFHTGKIGKGCGWASIKNVAERKLDALEYAHVLDDLKAPPGNRLEALKGNFVGHHSIRINDQWRVIFK